MYIYTYVQWEMMCSFDRYRCELPLFGCICLGQMHLLRTAFAKDSTKCPNIDPEIWRILGKRCPEKPWLYMALPSIKSQKIWSRYTWIRNFDPGRSMERCYEPGL